jgi:ankyrin repeat protein
LLKAGADVEGRTSDGQTPLHLAAAAGHADLIPLLITPAVLDQQDDDGYSPLQLAAKHNQLEAVQVLVDAGASLGTPGSKSDAEAIQLLLKAGVNMTGRTSGGRPSLHLAAATGHTYLMTLLITPATLNQQDEDGYTPLQLAAKNLKIEAVRVLVAAGASLGATATGPSPFNLAVSAGHELRHSWDAALLVAMLLWNAMLAAPRAAALVASAVRWRDSAGRTALHIAARHGSRELASKLVEAGADRNAVEGDGGWQATPLWTAAEHGHAHLVPLLATRSNINMFGPTGETALCIAAEKGHNEAVAALLAAGAAVNGASGRDSAPLLLAAERGSMDVVRTLLAAGARADEKDTSGYNCLAAAAVEGRMGVATLLLETYVTTYAAEQSKQHQLQRATPVELAAAAVVSVAKKYSRVPRCMQLLSVVLNVLGPELTRQVCGQAQLQLQRWIQPPRQRRPPWNRLTKTMVQPEGGRSSLYSYVAEALLLGWALAQHPLVPRLKRLVPGVTAGAQQAGRQEGGGPKLQQPQNIDRQLVQLVTRAAVAAGGGHHQGALHLFRDFDLLHLLQPCSEEAIIQGSPAGSTTTTSLQLLLHRGLEEAAKVLLGAFAGYSAAGGASQAIDPDQLKYACSFLPPGVYTTFLAAWVEARQQRMQKLAGAVVAAVAAAQQPQQKVGQVQGPEQQQQGPRQEVLLPPQLPQRQQQQHKQPDVSDMEDQLQPQQKLPRGQVLFLTQQQQHHQAVLRGARRHADDKFATTPPACGCGLWQVGDGWVGWAFRVMQGHNQRGRTWWCWRMHLPCPLVQYVPASFHN